MENERMDNVQTVDPVAVAEEAPKRKSVWKNPRGTALFVAFVLLFSAIGGYTLAYLALKDGAVKDEFYRAAVDVSLSYASNNKNDANKSRSLSDVHVKNDGNTAAYIRVAVVANWTVPIEETTSKKTYDIYASYLPQRGTDYIFQYGNETDSANNFVGFNSTDWFVIEENGAFFYYYKKPVMPGAVTNNLCNTCTMYSTDAPGGYSCSVEFSVQAIQAVGGFENSDGTVTPAVIMAWGSDVQVDSSGNLSAKTG